MIYINNETNNEIKDNEILFIGCSHTEGIGHSNKDTVYTHLLAKELNLIPLIDAHSGRGNYLTEEKLNTYKLQNKKVIIQFTDIYRIKLNGVDYDAHSIYRQFTNSQLEVYTDEVLYSLFFEQVKRMVNLLKATNSKFLFFTLGHPNTNYYGNTESIISIFFDNMKCYNTFCPIALTKYDYDKAEDNEHYGPKAHKFFSKMLLAQWRKMYDE